MSMIVLLLLLMGFTACVPGDSTIEGRWRGSGGSLTFHDDFVLIEKGGVEIKEPYELSPSFIKVMAKPGLMGALLIPYHQDGDRLVLDPGGMTEKVYSRISN